MGAMDSKVCNVQSAFRGGHCLAIFGESEGSGQNGLPRSFLKALVSGMPLGVIVIVIVGKKRTNTCQSTIFS